MSLLDKGNADVTVYLSQETTDPDGNVLFTRDTVGISTRAMVQPAAQSGTSARRAEQENEGYESEEMYSIRFPRSFSYELDPYAQVKWDGKMWSVFGHPLKFFTGRRTGRNEYMLRRV